MGRGKDSTAYPLEGEILWKVSSESRAWVDRSGTRYSSRSHRSRTVDGDIRPGRVAIEDEFFKSPCLLMTEAIGAVEGGQGRLSVHDSLVGVESRELPIGKTKESQWSKLGFPKFRKCPLTMKVPSKTPVNDPGTYRKPDEGMSLIKGMSEGVTNLVHSSSYCVESQRSSKVSNAGGEAGTTEPCGGG